MPTGELRNFVIDTIDQSLSFSTQARQGSASTLKMVFSNVGHSGSILTAALNSPCGTPYPVGQLRPGETPLTFNSRPNITGLVRGQTASRGAIIESDAGNFVADVDYTIVGPVLRTTSVDQYTADLTFVGQTSAFQTTLVNITPDVAYSADLTAMTTLGISISGPDAASFSFVTPNAIVGTRLDNNELVRANLLFTPLHAGDLNATITVVTDVNAALGRIGTSYAFDVFGTAFVPEPTCGVTGLGLASVALRRRRRQTP